MDSGSGSMLMVIIAVAFFAILSAALYVVFPDVVNNFFSNLSSALSKAWTWTAK